MAINKKIKHKKDEHIWKVAHYQLVNGKRAFITEHCWGCETFRKVPYEQEEAKSTGPMIMGLTSVTGTEKWGHNE